MNIELCQKKIQQPSTKSFIFPPRAGKLEPKTDNESRNGKEEKVDMAHKRKGRRKLNNLSPYEVESSPGTEKCSGHYHVERDNCLEGEDVRKTQPSRGIGHGKGNPRN